MHLAPGRVPDLSDPGHLSQTKYRMQGEKGRKWTKRRSELLAKGRKDRVESGKMGENSLNANHRKSIKIMFAQSFC